MPNFDSSNSGTKKKNKASKGSQFLLLLVLVLTIACGVLIYLYIEERKNANSPEVQSQDTQQVISELRKIIVLPDETPTIATVTDNTKLIEDNPDFYQGVENGDKLIIYQKKAILYRPSDKIIINVAPVIRETPIETPAVEEATTPETPENVEEQGNN
ncbi:hypothetical protein GF357_02050 [Candidatus Dojkabacteria bacterium]|nr:hypothetical protein [Candidatus Dojkabacteria bacterium]